MELKAALHRRKMVRSFLQQPVPHDVIDKVMSSVLHAPSAGFTQGNEFLVLDEPAAIAEFFRLTNPETDAPLSIPRPANRCRASAREQAGLSRPILRRRQI